MRCFGRTKKLDRCKNKCSFILCRHHKLQWWGVIIILTTLGGFYQDILKPFTGYYTTSPEKKVEKENLNQFNPLFKENDSLTFNVLITRFEDFKSDKNTYCIGRSIEEHLNILKSNEGTSMPIEVIYVDSIPTPKNRGEAKQLQKEHNADLVIYGVAKKLSNFCGDAEICFRYKFDNNILPKEVSMFELKTFSHTGKYIKTTSDNIEKGVAQVDALSMKQWIKSLVGIKANKKKTVVFDIAAIRNNIKELPQIEKAKNYNSLGEMYYDSRQYEIAKLAFEESVKIHPTAEFYRDLGKVNRRLKNYKESFECFDKGLKLEPNNDKIFNSKGLSFLYKKEYDSALFNYKKALLFNPKNEYANNNIAKVYKIKEDYKTAIDYYFRALKNNPKNKVSYFGLGLIHNNKAEYDKAIKYYSLALEIDSTYTKVYSYRGYSFLCRGDYEKAINDLSIYMSVVKDDYVDYSNRASAYNKIGEYDLAIKDCKKAISLNSKHTAPYYILGEVYSKLEENTKALNIYNKIIELDSLDTYSYKERAYVYSKLNKKNKALKDCEKIIKIDINDAHAYALKASFLSQLNQFDRAIISYNKSIKIDTFYNRYIHTRANANFYLGNYDLAIKDIKKAIKYHPKSLHYNFDYFYFSAYKYWFISLLIIALVVFLLVKKLMRL